MSSSLSIFKRRRSADATSSTSKSRKSLSPYDRAFEQNLIDHGIYLDNRAQKPENWADIKDKLATPRHSLSDFTETEFEAFQANNLRVKDEDDIMIDIIPVIAGLHQENHFFARKTKFGNLEPLTDGNIAPDNPDLFYGSRPEELNRQIRDKLKHLIVPSTMDDKPMAPNFYVAAKGPDGSASVARRQACYDGAIGARGMHSLQSYKQDASHFNGYAHTLTSTYYDGMLKIYTVHITPPAGPGGRPEYQMTQMRCFAMTDTVETFRQGATAFRNGLDLAKEWRKEFILAANERELSTIESSNFSRTSVTTNTHQNEESETSAEESSSSVPTPC